MTENPMIPLFVVLLFVILFLDNERPSELGLLQGGIDAEGFKISTLILVIWAPWRLYMI